MREMEFEDIQAHLSVSPEPTSSMLSRRTFLKAAAAGAGMSLMPGWLMDGVFAKPLGPTDGVLVLIQLGGGNDGLNTVVPTGNGTYYDKRKALAVKETDALNIANGVGLHPALVNLKKRHAAGKVAVVQGVGYANPDLSHFESTATWMSGWAKDGAPRNGWVGRFLDGLESDALNGIVVGGSVPLHMQGAKSIATALPSNKNGVFGFGRTDPSSVRLYEGVKKLAGPTNLGGLGDLVGATNKTSMELASKVGSCYPDKSGTDLPSEMALCAKLINADFGARVLSVSCGSFDTHANQAYTHNVRLAEVDNAIEAFFTTLDPKFAKRVTVMTFSEFGRRVASNGSGTDHGTASPLFVIGDNVKGGLYGAQPSLTDLDKSGNMKPAVMFHSVYASVLDKWMNADSTALLGKAFEPLPLFKKGPG